MEEKDIIKKYEAFLKLNHLELSLESAKDFSDLYEEISPLKLSMEYVNKGNLLASYSSKKKYYEKALKVEPNNFAARVCLLEIKAFHKEEFQNYLDQEYDRLLALDYMNEIYYEKQKVDFDKYQETFNYLRGLRSFYIFLIANGEMEEAIPVGATILELNPSDHFHIGSSLPFLYLKFNDALAAMDALKDRDNLIPGTKEIVQAYAAYLNLDEEKSLSYLVDLNAVNPYFYRLYTKEAIPELVMLDGNSYSESEFLYLNAALLLEQEDFQRIVDCSMEENPLENTVSSDAYQVLDLFAYTSYPYDVDNVEIYGRSVKSPIGFWERGRIVAAIHSLEVQKILNNGVLTPYGMVFQKHIKKTKSAKIYELHEKAKECFSKEEVEQGLSYLEEAMKENPKALELRVEYVLAKKEMDPKEVISLMSDLHQEYKSYIDFTEYSLPFERQALLEAMDMLSYQYYLEAGKNGLEAILSAYQAIENPFYKYTNMVEMIRYQLGEELDEHDPTHIFYLIYKTFKETGKVPQDEVNQLSRLCKMDYTDALRDNPNNPYLMLDPEFWEAYRLSLIGIPPSWILSKSEYQILEIIREGGKRLEDAKLSYEYLANTMNLERVFILEAKDTTEDYEIPYYIFMEDEFD